MSALSAVWRRATNVRLLGFLSLLLTLFVVFHQLPVTQAQTVTSLVAPGAVWKYLDNGSDQGTAWRAPSFNDAAWASGAAQLGYGDGDEATVISFGPDANNKYITSYFRRSFTVANPAAFASLTLYLKRDDGAVVYLNGNEIFRNNLAAGAVAYNTLASAAADDGAGFINATVPVSALASGTNVLAVEIHQTAVTSSDVSFDLELAGAPVSPVQTLVAAGASWKYLDNGSNQGTAWRANSFNDTAWANGAAQLGYGDGDEATVVGYGADAANKYVTTYFRRAFTVTNAAALTQLNLSVRRDDGAVVYLNGAEIWRDNLPAGAVAFDTLAAAAADDGAIFLSATLSTAALAAPLIEGVNVIAVEMHQAAVTSSDLSFDLQLTGSTAAVTTTVTRGPYLQKGTPNSLIARWRTNLANAGRVRYGTTQTNLNLFADEAAATTEHSVALNNLSPNTTYFYSIGTSASTLAGGDADHFFVTPPIAGTAKNTRIWVLGDAGTATANQRATRDAYYGFNGARYTDLWLMLGDNAYASGTDSEYQAAVFNIYQNTLRQSVLWSTLGNHDTAQSANPAATLPYYQIFDLPQNAEAGGLASGTEDYYSFDYGNIHFVCLDSMTSSRAAGSPMLTWLQNDLAANNKTWLIAFWHHPPYTKGSHDSDTETELIEMRQNALPILESYGVDLVLTGHSHAYERSFLIDSHYGNSTTFSNTMKKNGGDGRIGGGGAYTKPTVGPGGHEGAVYAVAGSSGQATGGALNHPAMFISLNNLGSMVLDVNGNQLDAKFVRETGAVADSFTLTKGSTANAPPTVRLTTPANASSFIAPAVITINANAADSDGSVIKVDFYQSTTLLGTDTTAPYSFVWSGVAAGAYSLTARAIDNQNAVTNSGAVSVTVKAVAPPAAPSNLAGAVFSRSRINLSWMDNSKDETGFKLERSTNGISFTQIAAPRADTTSYANTGLMRNTLYYYRLRATNANGDSSYSNMISARTIQ